MWDRREKGYIEGEPHNRKEGKLQLPAREGRKIIRERKRGGRNEIASGEEAT